ncbi:MAG: ribosomal protein S18-alanine N-acetyltransferase [Candidatus Dormibacteraceae bacterium]
MVQFREQLLVEPMRDGDVPTVQAIERLIFSSPWPSQAYYRELSSPANAAYLVLRRSSPQPSIVGYAGMWRAQDEAHVTTIGVRADLQRRGYGRVLFASLLQEAYQGGAKWVTLEVRVSATRAINLYAGFGFKIIGCRPGYYVDNRENALVMWSDAIYAPPFRKVWDWNWARIEAEVRRP